MNEFRNIKPCIVKYYEIPLDNINNISNITSKAYLLKTLQSETYFIKKTTHNALEKYHYLYNQGTNNILYPILNKKNNYVTRNANSSIYISNYYNDITIKKDAKLNNLIKNIDSLHQMTSFKKQLDPLSSRPKFEEITRRLDFQFRILEDYIRKVELDDLKDYSMGILSNYQYILNAKSELIKLQKRIISTVKSKESINFSFIHNNPKLDHLINVKGYNYLCSIENGKIGLSSLDFAKLYVENEMVNIDFKSIIKDILIKENNHFEYDYFRYLVLFIYIMRIKLTNNDHINSAMIVNVSESIKKYFENFSDE